LAALMPEKPAVTPDNLVPALVTQAARRGFSMGWRGLSNVQHWQQRAGQIFRDLALADLPETDANMQVLANEDRGDHAALHLSLTLIQDLPTEAILLLPKGRGPFPAVLALHDHGSEFAIGKEKCIPPIGGPKAQARGWHARFFAGQPMGQELARRGYVVLSVDALGWGARQGNGYESQQALAANLMQLGESPAGIMALEDQRALQFLSQLPQVDAMRLAVVGFSLGAFRAWQLAALSPLVAATIASGWMASLPHLMVPGNNHLRGQSAFWMTHPGLHRHLDLPDVAALSAPRPMFVQVGKADHLFPALAVQAAFETLSSVWQAHGAPDRLALSRPEGGHVFGPDRQTLAFDWLDQALQGKGKLG
jgi:dienelactone hydrolase